MMRPLLIAVLASVSVNLGAEELGRLFFTPQERDNLDRQRRGERSTFNRAPAVNGYIKRSDGRNTIWVDGGAVRATDTQIDQALVEGGPSKSSGIRITRSADEAARKPESRKPAPPTR